MSQTESLALDWNANKIAILNRLEACETRQEKTDAFLAILPVLSNTVEEMHDRMVRQEVAHEERAHLVDALQTEVALLKERETMSSKGVVATAATGAAGGGVLGNLDFLGDLLSKFGGG
jgi:hypothetical protein